VLGDGYGEDRLSRMCSEGCLPRIKEGGCCAKHEGVGEALERWNGCWGAKGVDVGLKVFEKAEDVDEERNGGDNKGEACLGGDLIERETILKERSTL
jgi:hypothetical protein